jgi:Uncharacterised conserved protein (DUF2368)
MERYVQMHYMLYERNKALEVAKQRELFYWIASFYGVSCVSLFSRFRSTKRPVVLAPILPLSFVLGYYADLAYGSKLHRIAAEAEMIMQNEQELLEWPCGQPTISEIDQARMDLEDSKKLHPVPPNL